MASRRKGTAWSAPPRRPAPRPSSARRTVSREPTRRHSTGRLSSAGTSPCSGAKSAAVPHPDGSHRRLYCVESPESWFEDFGRGTLACGEAEVRLDRDFAAIVDATDYLVFITGDDGRSDLSVSDRTSEGFRVKATAGSRRDILLACRGEAQGHCGCSPRARRHPKGADAAGRAGLSLRAPAFAAGPSADGSATAPPESEAVAG